MDICRFCSILQFLLQNTLCATKEPSARQTGVGPVPVVQTTERRDHLQDIQDAAGRETGKDL